MTPAAALLSAVEARPTGISEIDAFLARILPDPEVRLIYAEADTPSP